MGMGGGGRGGPLTEINVTPLVDVMLVLLIIFMVAAPMMTSGVEVDLPAAEAPRMDIDEDKLLISITADGKIFLGETEIALDALETTLRGHEQLQRDKEIFVQADEAVPYGAVVRVLAIVRQVGVEKMGLVTDPLASE